MKRKSNNSWIWVVLIFLFIAASIFGFPYIIDWRQRTEAINKAVDELEAMLKTETETVESWAVYKETNPIDGNVSAYAVSESFSSLAGLKYEGTGEEATIQIEFHCDHLGNEMIYVSFHPFYDLENGKRDMFGDIIHYTSRIRWNAISDNYSSVHTVNLMSDSSDRDILHFENDRSIIYNISRYDTFVFELDWDGLGLVHFEIPLAGSTEGINRARNVCQP